MHARIKVLMVAAANSTTGGGEKHLADLVKGLKKRGIEVALVAPAGGDLSKLAEQQGVPYYAADIDAGFSFRKVKQVRAAIEEYKPDVVHAHGTRAALFARLADASAAKRVVYTVHGIHIDKGRLSLAKLLTERRLVRKTAQFITVCESDKAKGLSLGTLASGRTTTVYNGVEPVEISDFDRRSLRAQFREELGVRGTTPVILHVGRSNVQKDQRTLIHAFSQVLDEVPDAVLAAIVSGESEAVGRLQSEAEALGCASQIKWLTPRSNLASAYIGADAFALSSLWEGFPYVIVEAMNYGCPVVSTNVDGIPEAVRVGIDGLLVGPGDSAALGRALVDVLMMDDGQREAMIASAHDRCGECFNLDQMVENTIEVYQKVIRG